MQKNMLYNLLLPTIFTIRPDFEKTAIFDHFDTDSRGRRKDPILPELILLKEGSILLFKSLEAGGEPSTKVTVWGARGASFTLRSTYSLQK